MAFIEAVRVALESLWANKLRAMLTMLGVIIGVFSVLIMIALVQGLQKQFMSNFAGNGADLVFAYYAPRPDSAARGGFSGMTLADTTAVRAQCLLVGTVSPEADTQVTAQAGKQTKNGQLCGVLSDYLDANAVKLAQGRFLDDTDESAYGKAVVLGAKVKQTLFGNGEALGKSLVCSQNGATVSLVVVGVLAEKDRSFNDANNSLYAALSTVQKRFTGNDHIDSFSTRAASISDVDAAADQVWAVLKQRHPLNIADIVVDTQESAIKQVTSFLTILQLVLGGIAGLALLTGGIGIMNIMLVSVTERTREIGIRKAVGATRGVILLQFVIEAMVVSGLGGVLGILGAFGVGSVVNSVQKGITMFIPGWAIGLGFGFAVSVGLFFGIYPAFRAAKLDPIVALRYE